MSTEALFTDLDKAQRRAFQIGAAGLLVLSIGYFADSDQFYRSWLIACLYWLAPTLGSLGLVMLHGTTSGAWGFGIRRMLDAAMRNLPLMALLFVPLLLGGVHALYEWSHADAVAADPILQHKAVYLNRTFFTLRTVFYFGLWGALAYFMLKTTAGGVRTIAMLRWQRTLGGVGLGLYVLSMSFASFDWAMSLEPHWFSTIYGVLFVIGQGLSTFCLCIFVASRLARYEPCKDWFDKQLVHDLGNLTMAFVMLWAYVSFSQFLIIWSGNLPEETPWYLNRIGHGWQAIALVLVAFHFVVPFLILLNRRAKRNLPFLASLAVALLFMRFLEIFWLIAPAFGHAEGGHGGGFSVSWMDLVAPVGIGGLWVGLFLQNLRRRPLTPPKPLGLHLPGEAGEEVLAS